MLFRSYGLGPYIADYPKQVLLSGVVQGWCPKYVLPLLYLYPYEPLTRTFLLRFAHADYDTITIRLEVNGCVEPLTDPHCRITYL